MINGFWSIDDKFSIEKIKEKFCDSFKIVVSDTSAYQQSGNSIVVDVLMKICTEIFNKLES